MNILGELNESHSDPQLRTKIKFLSQQNETLTHELAATKKANSLLLRELESYEAKASVDPSLSTVLAAKNKRIEELEAQLECLRQENLDLRYKNFVSSQVAEYVKVIEADLTAFYDSRLADFKFRLENLMDKIKEMELLKSIPLGTHRDIKYFLITKNVVSIDRCTDPIHQLA